VRRALPILALVLLAPVALADGARPAALGFAEVAPGQFDVVFKVPRSGNRIPALRPVLPAACRRITEPETELTPGEQVTRWRIAAAPWEVAGQPIRIEGLAATINDTLVRFRFLDGSIVTRILMPEMPYTEFPARAGRAGATAGTSAVRPAAVRATVRTGLEHAFFGLGHLILVVGLALSGRLSSVLAALTAFAIAHLIGILASVGIGVAVPAAPAEAILFVAGAVAAARGKNLATISLVAGLLHGAAVATASTAGTLPLLGLSIGIDAAQVVVGVAAVLVGRMLAGIRLKTVCSYAVGVSGVFLALTTITETEAGSPRPPDAPLLLSLIPPATGGPTSVALAPTEDAAVRVFLSVEPVDIRVEAVLRLASFLDARETIPVEDQAAVKERFAAMVADRVTVRIDGTAATPVLTRIDFVETGATGVLERPEPVVEPFAKARLGVVLVFPVRGVPEAVEVAWGIEAPGEPVRGTIIDPERTYVTEGAAIGWKNELREPPPPTAGTVARRQPRLPVSILSLGMIALSLAWLLTRGGRTAVGLTAARMGIALAGLAAPILPVTLPLPSSGVPDGTEAQVIAEALLTNVHRAFDHHDESAVYERLDGSVTGDALTEIYLEHRENLLLAAQGGARARADAVEVTGARDVAPVDGDGFRVEVSWQVSGFVVHFGHRHFRRNVYRAIVTVVPDGEAWKIRSIEIRDKSRIR